MVWKRKKDESVVKVGGLAGVPTPPSPPPIVETPEERHFRETVESLPKVFSSSGISAGEAMIGDLLVTLIDEVRKSRELFEEFLLANGFERVEVGYGTPPPPPPSPVPVSGDTLSAALAVMDGKK